MLTLNRKKRNSICTYSIDAIFECLESTKLSRSNSVVSEKFFNNYLINKNIKPIVTLMSKIEYGYRIYNSEPLVFKTLLDENEAQNEIEILKKIRKISNTADLIDSFIKDGNQVLVFHKFKRFSIKNLNLNQITSFIYQLLKIIKNLNKINVVHMDIKPENLMLNSENKLVLIDFGLAKEYKNLSDPIEACGTTGYTAPELIEGEEVINNKIDIYSSGCLFGQMLDTHIPKCHLNYFGSQMFHPNHLLEILDCLDEFISQKLYKNDHLYLLADILKLMLDPNPLNRPDADNLLNHSLFASFKN